MKDPPGNAASVPSSGIAPCKQWYRVATVRSKRPACYLCRGERFHPGHPVFYGLGIPFQNVPPTGGVLSSHPLEGDEHPRTEFLWFDSRVGMVSFPGRALQPFYALIRSSLEKHINTHIFLYLTPCDQAIREDTSL